MKGIILHGGYRTRLRLPTHTGPKQLIPVANKPISQYILEDLIEAGINEISIVLGNTHPEKVKEYYGNRQAYNAKINHIPQSEPKKKTPCTEFALSDFGLKNYSTQAQRYQ